MKKELQRELNRIELQFVGDRHKTGHLMKAIEDRYGKSFRYKVNGAPSAPGERRKSQRCYKS